jgi:hypothetical protein
LIDWTSINQSINSNEQASTIACHLQPLAAGKAGKTGRKRIIDDATAKKKKAHA